MVFHAVTVSVEEWEGSLSYIQINVLLWLDHSFVNWLFVQIYFTLKRRANKRWIVPTAMNGNSPKEKWVNVIGESAVFWRDCWHLRCSWVALESPSRAFLPASPNTFWIPFCLFTSSILSLCSCVGEGQAHALQQVLILLTSPERSWLNPQETGIPLPGHRELQKSNRAWADTGQGCCSASPCRRGKPRLLALGHPVGASQVGRLS